MLPITDVLSSMTRNKAQSAYVLAHPSHLKHGFPQEAVQIDTVVGQSETLPVLRARAFQDQCSHRPNAMDCKWSRQCHGPCDPSCLDALPHTKLVAVDEACDYYLGSLLESRIFLLAVQVLSRYGLVLCPM